MSLIAELKQALRRAEGWRPMLYSGMDALSELRAIGRRMALAQIYEGTLTE